MSSLAVFPMLALLAVIPIAGGVVLAAGLFALGSVALRSATGQVRKRVTIHRNRQSLIQTAPAGHVRNPGARQAGWSVSGPAIVRVQTPFSDLQQLDLVLSERELATPDGETGQLSVAVPAVGRTLVGRDGEPVDAYIVDDQERVAFGLRRMPNGRFAAIYVSGEGPGRAASDSPWACDTALVVAMTYPYTSAVFRRCLAQAGGTVTEVTEANGTHVLRGQVPMPETGGYLPFELTITDGTEVTLQDSHVLPNGRLGPCETALFDEVLHGLSAPSGARQPSAWAGSRQDDAGARPADSVLVTGSPGASGSRRDR